MPNTFYTKDGITNIDPATKALATKAVVVVEDQPMTEEEVEEWADQTAKVWVKEDTEYDAAIEGEMAAWVEHPDDYEGEVSAGPPLAYTEFRDVLQFMAEQDIAIPDDIQERIDSWTDVLEEPEAVPDHLSADPRDISADPQPIAPAALRPGRNPDTMTDEVMPGNVVPSTEPRGSVRVMQPKPEAPIQPTTKPTLVPPGEGRNVHTPEIAPDGQPYPSNPPLEGAINLPPSARPPVERGMPNITPVKPKTSE